MSIIEPYGNAEPGDYPALFTGCFEAKFPKATRLIFGFVILNPDRKTAHDGPNGGGLYAVAVCNLSEGNNPKSKPFLIRRAMLQREEFEDLALSIKPPPPEHFEKAFEGRPRVLEIRVAQRETDGKQVSVVTHIRRPRDGEWRSIEGVYEGRQSGTRHPFWLQNDGTAIPYPEYHQPVRKMVDEGRLTDAEAMEWYMWRQTREGDYRRWLNPDGSLRELSVEEVAELGVHNTTIYQIAQRRAALGLLPKIEPEKDEHKQKDAGCSDDEAFFIGMDEETENRPCAALGIDPDKMQLDDDKSLDCIQKKVSVEK